MKFNFTDPQPAAAPTLADVKINQFFVTTDDKLCQKVTHDSFNIVAHPTANNGPLLNNSALMASCTQTTAARLPGCQSSESVHMCNQLTSEHPDKIISPII